jgi:S1-C subfamily serine protease
MQPQRSWKHFAIVFATSVAAVLFIRETEVLEYVSYRIEKGRLRALAEQVTPEEMIDALQTPNRRVAALVTPAVVYIETTRVVSLSDFAKAHESLQDSDAFGKNHARIDDEEFVRFESGLGSGFVFDAEAGYVMTNYHVANGADRIDVVLHDGRRFEAQVVGADRETDLAVLRVDAERLHEIKFGDSGSLSVGDDVFALGNPFGLDGTFSSGIVSRLGRSNISIKNVTYQGFIQTDAVINPGNSGGPLVNLRGEVVGVNTAIASESGTFAGVGFAIPSRRIVQLLPQLIKGKVVRGFLGVGHLDVHAFRERAIEELGWSKSHGVIVNSVLKDSPAEACGLRAGDVIVAIGGVEIKDSIEIRDYIAAQPPGKRISIRFWRSDRFMTVETDLVERVSPPF